MSDNIKNERDLLNQKLSKIKGDKTMDNLIKAQDVLPTKDVIVVDFVELRAEVETMSKDTINDIAAFHFEDDTLSEEARQMVNRRKNLDVISLHTVIYQLKTSDFAISKLLDELNSGTTTNVRLFESLVGMQRSNMEAQKTLNDTIAKLEKQYVALEAIIREKGLFKKDDEGNEDVNIKRGTKGVLEDMSDLEDEIKMLNNGNK